MTETLYQQSKKTSTLFEYSESNARCFGESGICPRMVPVGLSPFISEVAEDDLAQDKDTQ